MWTKMVSHDSASSIAVCIDELLAGPDAPTYRVEAVKLNWSSFRGKLINWNLMNESKISVRYSKALLQFALEKKKLDPVYQDMLQLYQICQQVDELISIFHNPIIPQSRKNKIVRAVFSGKVTDITLSFLEMVIHNKREIYIPDISRRFLDDYKRHKKITTVIFFIFRVYATLNNCRT